MTEPASVIQFQRKQEARFVCSACGEDRSCNCNAPALEKLAEMQERNRVASRERMKRKREQDQFPVTRNEEGEEEEASDTPETSNAPFQGDIVKLATSRVCDFARGYEKEMNAKQRREFRARLVEKFNG